MHSTPTLRLLPQLLRTALLALATSATLPALAADTTDNISAAGTAATAGTDNAQSLPAITITGQAPGATEGTRSYTTDEMRSATRMDLSLRETPQSVSVITRQLLDDLGAIRLDQALGMTTGIQVGQQDSERTRYYARGFGINNIQVDGMPTGSNSPLQDTVLYDRVEVVRGPNGLMGGTGDPSATINMIRKRPTKTFQASYGVSLGRWDNHRVEADISTPLTQSGSVRARATAAWQERDSYFDMYHERKTVGMAIVEADLQPGTLLTAGVDFQDNKPTGATWGAVPYWNADGSLANLPRNTSLTTPWSTWANKQHTVFTSLDHHLPGSWKLHLGYARTESSNSTTVAYAGSGYPNPQTGAGMSLWSGVWGKGTSTADNFDLYASGPFALLGRKHTAIIGWNGGNTDARSLGGDAIILYPAKVPDYRTWTGNIPKPTFRPDGTFTRDLTRLAGGYVATRLSLADPLHVIIGARTSTYRTETRAYDARGMHTGTSNFSETRNEVTPYAGLVWDLNRQYSLYASYTELFNPQSSKDRNNHFLPPETGDNKELGIKGEFFEGKLNASAAVFQTKKKNLAELDTTVPQGFLLPDGGQAYVANGDGITAKGIEFDVSGQLAPGWNASGGYTYLHAEEADGARAVPTQPRHLLRLSTSYRFDGALQGLQVGGSATAQSATYSETWYGRPPARDYTARIPQAGYALYNAMASYALTAKTSVQLNVNNLLDKKYYRNVGFYDSVFWGEPRNVTVSLRGKF